MQNKGSMANNNRGSGVKATFDERRSPSYNVWFVVIHYPAFSVPRDETPQTLWTETHIDFARRPRW